MNMKNAIVTAALWGVGVSFAGAGPDTAPSLVSIAVKPGIPYADLALKEVLDVTVTNNGVKPVTFWTIWGGWTPNAALFGVDGSKQQKAVYPPPNGDFSGGGSIVTIQPGKSETIRMAIPSEAMKPVYKAYILSVKFDAMGANFADAGTIYSAPFQLPAPAK
ncbi:MAG TPA: hypothetical protein VG733_16355 [Chthoniobacteraceae bacterium]|nr:hypothetical protein [Chthoniobacteraceae bacterium]